jgi:3-(3-hydroxy-phenyl)propionate hydroxylase
VPGSVSADAPVNRDGDDDWLLSQLGDTFSLLIFGGTNGLDANARGLLAASTSCRVPVRNVVVLPAGAQVSGTDDAAAATLLFDREGLAAERYDAKPGTAYLIRPDQHVCARWRAASAADLEAALARALCANVD